MGAFKFVIFLLVIIIPIAYAYEIGGSFGINIVVTGNSSDVNDTNPDESGDSNIETEIYYHSYVTSIENDKREENYAYNGEEAHFEIYVQKGNEVDGVTVGDVECSKKRSKLNDGDGLGDEFSENADYDKETMDYYECSFIVTQDIKGDQEINIDALDNGDVVKEENDDWSFNPELKIEVNGNSDKFNVQNMNGVSLDIKQSCNNNSKLLESEDEISLSSCGTDGYVIAAIK